MARTVVMFCACTHAFQDRQYGDHQRVHNQTGKMQAKLREYRCTACGNKKTK